MKRHFLFDWKERAWRLARDDKYHMEGYWYFWSPAHAAAFPERGPHSAFVASADGGPDKHPWLFV
jgi:hypothetical protein